MDNKNIHVCVYMDMDNKIMNVYYSQRAIKLTRQYVLFLYKERCQKSNFSIPECFFFDGGPKVEKT